MRKVEGHVLQPIREHFEKRMERELPKRWTIRSRCTPDYEKQMDRIMKALGGL